MSLDKWGSQLQLVTKLLEVTHKQWLYRNIHMHDAVSGDLVTWQKDDIRWDLDLEDKMKLGGEGLAKEDLYLLEINLDSFDSSISTGEEQAYWQAAPQMLQQMR